jgi:hypothetical protein
MEVLVQDQAIGIQVEAEVASGTGALHVRAQANVAVSRSNLGLNEHRDQYRHQLFGPEMKASVMQNNLGQSTFLPWWLQGFSMIWLEHLNVSMSSLPYMTPRSYLALKPLGYV